MINLKESTEHNGNFLNFLIRLYLEYYKNVQNTLIAKNLYYNILN